jgi:hypothetical protein
LNGREKSKHGRPPGGRVGELGNGGVGSPDLISGINSSEFVKNFTKFLARARASEVWVSQWLAVTSADPSGVGNLRNAVENCSEKKQLTAGGSIVKNTALADFGSRFFRFSVVGFR